MIEKILKKLTVGADPHPVGEGASASLALSGPNREAAVLSAVQSRARLIIQRAYQKGLALAQDRVNAALEEVRQIAIDQAHAEINKHLLEMEEDVVKLALAVAEKVCRVEIQTNRKIAEGVVREGLAVLGRRVTTTVRVHPMELEALRDTLQDILSSQPDVPITLEADASIEPGGAVLDGGLNVVDAQVASRLHQVRDHLIGRDHG